MAGSEERSDNPARKRMTQAERTALSDLRMHDAAIQLILEHGTHHMTLQEVGKRAGYSRGLASSRFGSKQALFTYLVDQFNTKWNAELARRVGTKTGLSAFLAGCEAVEAFIIGKSLESRAMYILWYESITSYEDVRVRHAGHHQALRQDAARWINEGIAEGSICPDANAQHLAVQFCSFLFGTVYQWLVDSESIDLHDTFSEYRKSMLVAIATRDADEGSVTGAAGLSKGSSCKRSAA